MGDKKKDEREDSQSLFRKLTRLFKSTPTIRRKVRGIDTTVAASDRTRSNGFALFQRSSTPTYSTLPNSGYDMAQRLMRYQEYHDMEQCLAGDTLIAVPCGYVPIKELAEKHGVDDEFVVYAYDHNQKKIVPAMAKQARQTCVDHAYKVKFDNGRELIGTINHRLLRRDGCFCEIGDLKLGDAMMPFRRRAEDAFGQLSIYTMDRAVGAGWVLEQALLSEWEPARPRCVNIERDDITFGRIVGVAQRVNFDHERVLKAFDVSRSVIDAKLRSFGYDRWATFVSAYERAQNNAHCVDVVDEEQSLNVVSIEYHGVIPLYDLTVDGYKNFATDFIISHNTPEISAALDLWADETVSQDDDGRILHVFSENERIRDELEDMFYNVVNTEFNLRPWVRNLPIRRGTFVPLLDGRNIAIEQVVEEVSAGHEIWVYSIQDETQKLVPGRVIWGGLTKNDSEITRVHLDDGSYIDVSPEHEFVLRDGSTKRADELDVDDSLMPFYRYSSVVPKDGLEGYEKVYNPSIDAHEFTHRIVARNACINKGEIAENKVIHHINFCKLNNEPTNLREMTWDAHVQLHAQHCKNVLHTPEVTAKRMIGIDRWLRSDQHRQQAREQLKWMQEQGLMAKSWSEYNNSDLHRQHNEIRRIAQKKDWSDPQRREARVKNLSIRFDDVCVDIIVEQLKNIGEYVGLKRLGSLLKLNVSFMSHFHSINAHSKRDITKVLNAREGLKKLLKRTSAADYWELIENRIPEIAATPVFKKYRDGSFSRRGHLTAMNTKKKNHKVVQVEFLNDRDDVYCIDVRGPNDEHDRHNFMVLGMNLQGFPTLNSGTCVKNCKHGDAFIFLDVAPGIGIQNAVPVPVNEMEREENYDSNDPWAVRFKFAARNAYLENWEVAHFRLLGNDLLLPYGTSVIEAARRIWRQLILAEDAMLVYRVTRAPDRWVFYLDVGNMAPEDITHYVEEQKKVLQMNQIIDPATGRVDARFNPMNMLENFYIPRRNKENGTEIQSLAGGQNVAAIEDVAYLQKKLFAALKVPKAYLSFDDGLGSKATAAQADIRLSRSIAIVQKTIIAELNKMASVHLFARGFRGDDLIDFTLRLSNPSTIAQQQKLELWRTRLEIAASSPDTVLSRAFIRREIFGLSEKQSKDIDSERYTERTVDATLDSVAVADESGGGAPGGGGGGGAGPSGGEGGGDEEEGPELTPPIEQPGGEGEAGEPEQQNAGDEPEEEEEPGLELLTSGDDPEAPPTKLTLDRSKLPVNVAKHIDRMKYNRSRVRHHGSSKTGMPDMARMTGIDTPEMWDPYDSRALRAYATNPFGEAARQPKASLGPDLERALLRMDRAKSVLTESSTIDNSDEIFTIVEEPNDPRDAE